ncbi:helix-turn-helix domain-containing protein [Lapidilactobacillus gannanensis]|uniref:Helix-turn-helix domain-containing protein n=1 Tax=Lapidilactobacillus gannanensis TaxID=2486002 RepID=A0ABW4BMK6_9LACO|nr:helix-turn-helix domain-containing protein [Lapidilactobacillus gannanensis]MCH4056887.1 helix-turn-helix domain-containing protein [Lactobacillaceae bacterium]
MREINDLVRELRQNRNLSQKSLAQGICSREALTKFEQRGTNISAKNLFLILDKMNINLEEFEFLLQDGELPFKQKIYQQGIRCLHDRAAHERYLAQLAELAASTNDEYYQLLATIFDVNQVGALPKLSDSSATKHLTNYLNSIDTWGRFELSLFINAMSLFPTDYILNTYKMNISKMYAYTKNPHYQDGLLSFFNNAGITLIRRHDFVVLAKLLTEYNLLTQNPDYASDRIIYLIFKKVVDAENNFQVLMIDEELKILNYLGYKELAKSLNSMFTNIFK